MSTPTAKQSPASRPAFRVILPLSGRGSSSGSVSAVIPKAAMNTIAPGALTTRLGKLPICVRKPEAGRSLNTNLASIFTVPRGLESRPASWSLAVSASPLPMATAGVMNAARTMAAMSPDFMSMARGLLSLSGRRNSRTVHNIARAMAMPPGL